MPPGRSFRGRGGGGSGIIFFRYIQVQINQIPSIPGDFCYISGAPADHPPFLDTHGNSGILGRSAYSFKERNNINSLEKKPFTKRLGGHDPHGPLATLLLQTNISYY